MPTIEAAPLQAKLQRHDKTDPFACQGSGGSDLPAHGVINEPLDEHRPAIDRRLVQLVLASATSARGKRHWDSRTGYNWFFRRHLSYCPNHRMIR